MKATRYFVTSFVIVTLSIGSMAMALAAPLEPSIHLKGSTFVPAAGLAAQGSQKYFIVQFAGPVQQSWKDAVTAEGAEILAYIPDFAFKVRMNPSIAKRVESQNFVRAVAAFQPGFKVGGDLKRDGEMRLYRILIEKGSDYGLVRALVAQTGAEILSIEKNMMVVGANGAFVDAITEVDDVASVSNFIMREKHNEYGAGDIMGANLANISGYDGSTQTVAVADTGLGGGTADNAHLDIPAGRIAGINNWSGASDSCWSITDDGAKDVDSGHGTHVSVSVLGQGDTTGLGKGTAPAAKLVFQATENWATMKGLCALYYPSGYYLAGLPADLGTLFQQAYTAGARIHSNSWGSAAAGDYTADSANADNFICSHRDMTITFSAGNEGVDRNSDGAIDNDSMGAPATAKNVLTVGASENDRQGDWQCDSFISTNCASGSNGIFTYGAAWPADYPAKPISDDPSAGNAQQMAAFSSRGPTDDGRIKPDVVAPGTWILSGYSDLYQQIYDGSANPQNGAWQYDGWGIPYSMDYKYMGGTSMSNPLVAGGAAVVRDYYKKAHTISASAALVKATLINSAVDLMDENNDGDNLNDFPIPNNHEGWGLVNLGGATDGSIQFVDEEAGLSTGGNSTFQITTTGEVPLKTSLVWTDYPSTETATKNLVNDLDLTVSGPSGTFKGNVFSGGWSAAGGSGDRSNNVENVYIQSPAAGTYTITVNAYNVPNGPQKFALVADGGAVLSVVMPTPMHVGDLDGIKAVSGKSAWKATVAITVHDSIHGVVSGAMVSGTWSGGATGTGSCATNSNGLCSITTGNISNKKTSTKFSVTGINLNGYSYTASDNHDIDTTTQDSNGTVITITKP